MTGPYAARNALADCVQVVFQAEIWNVVATLRQLVFLLCCRSARVN